MAALMQSECPGLRLVTRGKRDIYEFPGDESKLLFVATDRISAFDAVMQNGIPNKGKLLTKLSLFFFKKFESIIPNHIITGDFDEMISLSKQQLLPYRSQLEGRTILVKKCQVLKCEAIVRGYLTGSAYAEYKKTGTVHGIEMPKNLVESSKFPEPIFTPSTKADIGTHDENIHPDQLGEILGSQELAEQVKKVSIELYQAGNQHCESRQCGLFLADTKFEFGMDGREGLVLIDECLTPDSSRFWTSEEWAENKKMSGFDKQFLRDWLKEHGVDGQEHLLIPPAVIEATWSRYVEAFELLTGTKFIP